VLFTEIFTYLITLLGCVGGWGGGGGGGGEVVSLAFTFKLKFLGIKKTVEREL
jgi:hypothetical protein